MRAGGMIGLAAGALGLAAAMVAGAGAPASDELLELYRRRDYFELRERLGGVPGSAPAGPVELRFVAGAVQHAFNRPLASNRTLAELAAAGDLPRELADEARRLRIANHLRLYEYRAALSLARESAWPPAGGRESAQAHEARNIGRLLEALVDTPAQRVEVARTTRTSLRLDRRVAVEIGAHELRLAIDTGANFSVLMRSEAQSAGLAIREVGLQVTTATGGLVAADVAVAPRVLLGAAEFRHVVFLIFPDEMLTFENDVKVSGLVGLPMLEALGEVRFWSDNTVEIPVRPPRRKRSNLALDGHEPLVRARAFGEDLVCRLDTGSNRTFFYSSFYRRFRERIVAVGDTQRVEVAGVGGARTIGVYRVPFLTLSLARADIQLRRNDIYTAPLVGGADEYLDCTIGREALDGFRYYAINLRDMALVLG